MNESVPPIKRIETAEDLCVWLDQAGDDPKAYAVVSAVDLKAAVDELVQAAKPG